MRKLLRELLQDVYWPSLIRVHLMEVAQSLWQLEKLGVLSKDDIKSTKQWFADYLKWMFTHQYGIDEMRC